MTQQSIPPGYGTWREFDELDWMGFAGAESFPDGVGEPLMADVKVDDLDTIALLDANGVGLMVLTPDGEEIALLTATGMTAARFAATLKASYDTGELMDLGFTQEPRDHNEECGSACMPSDAAYHGACSCSCHLGRK